MAVVKYGSIVTEIKGKVNGQVFQKGNNGLILRTRAYSQGRTSQVFTKAKNNMSTIARLWASIDIVSQGMWTAAAPDWPFYDKFGNAYVGSGYQYFVAFNTLLLTRGLATVTMPQPVVANEANTVNVVSASYSGTYDLYMNNVYSQFGSMVIRASPPSSGSKAYGAYKLKTLHTFGTNGAIVFSFKGYYFQRFGLPNTGSYFACECIYRNDAFPQLTTVFKDIVFVDI